MKYQSVSSNDYGLKDRDAGEISAMIEQISQTLERLAKTASELRGHADRLYGQLPEACGVSEPSDASIHGGMFGKLSGVISRLASAEAEVTTQARRNCNLA